MILPVNSLNQSFKTKYNNNNKRQLLYNNCNNSLSLSGINNPMRSYISFGYCERNNGHYQKMYEIDTMFSEKVAKRIEQIKKAKEMYSLEEECNIEAAKIMMQYSNMQTVFAEMPPAYTIVTGTKLKEIMDKTQTFTDPVSNLITINNISKINGVNKELPQSRQSKATRAAQLYSTLILLDQIKENKTKIEYQDSQSKIDELISMVEKTIKEIYGDDILERVDKLSKMGRKVSLEDQKMALNFLIEIDCVSKDLKLPTEFEKKLAKLIENKNRIEGRTEPTQKSQKAPSKLIKVFYPDHEHTMEHINGTPHEHKHEHTSNDEYKEILDNMHSKKNVENTQVQVEEKKKKLLIGE